VDLACQVAAAEAPPEWTLDQIAGLAFGVRTPVTAQALPELISVPPLTLTLEAQAVLVASYFLSSKVDEAIARGQREELGLCVECGGLNDVDTCEEARCPNRQT